MSLELLSKRQFQIARDSYAISKSNLPAGFTWADKVQIPGRENQSDCGRSIAKLGMKVQGIKYPELKYFRKAVNSGRTGIDMYDLEKGMKMLGIECESYLNIHASTIIDAFAHSKDIWAFSHQMLAGHHTQYLNMKNGHYAAVVYADKYLITSDPGLRKPGWGRITPFVYDRICFDNKIDDPNEVVIGWAMRIGVSESRLKL